MAFGEIINSLAMIVCMVLPGFFLAKIKFFKEEFYDGLSSFAVNLCIPALIIHSLQVEYTPTLIVSLGKTFLFWLPALAFAALLAYIFSKILGYDRKRFSLLMCMLMISNTGFVGIPLISQLYGEESLFLASANEIVNDIFFYSIVYMAIASASDTEAKFSFRKAFVNPPIIALVIGIILFLCGITLPTFIGKPISYFSGATAPIALFVLGTRIAALTGKDFVSDWKVYIICFLRLIIMPLFAYIMVWVILKDHSLFGKVFILMQGMPAASVTVIMAQSTGSDVDFATKGVMLSTVLCLFTVPIFTLML